MQREVQDGMSPELAALLESVGLAVIRRPTDLRELRDAMEALYAFLASPGGRTHANVWAANLYFLDDKCDESQWEHLPESYQAVLWDTAGQLHDTISHPEVAENFQSTPEQLLQRTRALET